MSLLTLLIISYSCKKDKKEEPAPTPITYPNYSQLKVGNYWIYQLFNVDSLGNSTPTNDYDSCFIEKDTIINGYTYFKMLKPENGNGPNYYTSFIRDSLHYLVNSKGQKLFSSIDSLSILDTYYFSYYYNVLDTVCKVVSKMTNRNNAVNTPAGTFITLNYNETYYMYPHYTSGGNPRYKNTRYAENIGIVIETLPFYTGYPIYVERRLVRYHLN